MNNRLYALQIVLSSNRSQFFSLKINLQQCALAPLQHSRWWPSLSGHDPFIISSGSILEKKLQACELYHSKRGKWKPLPHFTHHDYPKTCHLCPSKRAFCFAWLQNSHSLRIECLDIESEEWWRVLSLKVTGVLHSTPLTASYWGSVLLLCSNYSCPRLIAVDEEGLTLKHCPLEGF